MRMVARQTVVRVAVAALVGILAYAGIAGAAVRKPAKTSVPVPQVVTTPSQSAPVPSAAAEPTLRQEPAEAQVNWQVMAGGGGSGTAGALQFSATIGQPIVGWTSATGVNVHAGFWQDFSSGQCCENRGNVDHKFSGMNPVSVADITYLIAYVFRGGPVPPCPEEADLTADGDITVVDITYLIAYVFRGEPAPPAC
ncbi:MAG TPA: hypothetical protein PK112_09015 [candidate division Zixibacteria bacterium]|nr:hypothetical protein [candidate division Zixibacteria bacterium]